MPPGHPCVFLFPFFLRFSFPFCRSRFPLPFRLVVFRLFLVSPSCFFFRFPALLDDGFWYFVSVLHPPRAACELASLRIPLAVCCLLSFLALLIFIYFSLPSLFSISIWTSFVSSCLVVEVIYAVSSVSVPVMCSSH